MTVADSGGGVVSGRGNIVGHCVVGHCVVGHCVVDAAVLYGRLVVINRYTARCTIR